MTLKTVHSDTAFYAYTQSIDKMSCFIYTILVIFLGQFPSKGSTSEPAMKLLYERTYPLMAERPPHQYNLWWRLLNYTTHTEGLSNCYVCANTPHSTDKPFRLQPVAIPEIQTKCLIWLQTIFLGAPDSPWTFWMSKLRRDMLRLGVDAKFTEECVTVCSYMYDHDSIPWVTHIRFTPAESMPSALQVQGKTNQIVPICICQNSGERDRWMGHSTCTRRYVNLERSKPWGQDSSSGNLWSSGNVTQYSLITDSGPKMFEVYHDSIIPTDKIPYIPLRGKYWICGGNAYHWLPKKWSGCCYVGTLDTHLTFMSRTGEPLVRQKRLKRVKRASRRTDYRPHLRTSPGVKTLEGVFPWYGTVHNAYLIDNISLELESFADYAIEGFHLLTEEMKDIKLVALQNRAALDYILAREGGVCALIGDQCCTYIPDINDNMTDVIKHMKQIRDEIDQSSVVSDQTDVFSWVKGFLGKPFWGFLRDLGTFLAVIITILLVTYISIRILIMLCKQNNLKEVYTPMAAIVKRKNDDVV